MTECILTGIICLCIGGSVGMVITALICANRRDDWKDEDTK
ncbi:MULTISPECIES: hypothetical protein [Erysipelotrichaceae]|nr:hypothetical protein [Absiella sp. AM27-20]